MVAVSLPRAGLIYGIECFKRNVTVMNKIKTNVRGFICFNLFLSYAEIHFPRNASNTLLNK